MYLPLETSVADLAHVRFGVAVRSKMIFQVILPLEQFRANVAAVGTLKRMGNQMFLQRVFVYESALALVALKNSPS